MCKAAEAGCPRRGDDCAWAIPGHAHARKARTGIVRRAFVLPEDSQNETTRPPRNANSAAPWFLQSGGHKLPGKPKPFADKGLFHGGWRGARPARVFEFWNCVRSSDTRWGFCAWSLPFCGLPQPPQVGNPGDFHPAKRDASWKIRLLRFLPPRRLRRSARVP